MGRVWLKLDRQADGVPIPLYYRIKQILRERIESDEWPTGFMVPSERDLCSEFGVSRVTIRQAMAGLINEGLLRTEQGRGTFVCRPKVAQGLLKFYSFSEDMRLKGLNPKSKVVSVEVVRPTRSIARHLRLEQNDEVVKLTRLRIADGEPFILETSWLPRSKCPGIELEDLDSANLYDTLTVKYGLRLAKATETFEPVLVDEYEAGKLEVKPGSAALLLERVTYDSNGQPVEFCKGLVRGDRCRYYVELLQSEG